MKKGSANSNPTMMDVIGTILSRLVNVALFIVIAILTLAALNGRTDLHLGLCAVLSIVSGLVGTVLIRLLLKGIGALGARSSSQP
ncbi:hypothetical protein [Brevibacterium spongiae]|uniref:Uncharacterized protein n=1 Tax=Brevibacterium spongiae TaxID=2909672 RepID=A0ABY5SSV2_9MICO|nr:hypothetical protein [Brevibacterium spongiae]UVI37665.1 hypothetical protein L1F31_08445 [Brevibacterium spongiae]